VSTARSGLTCDLRDRHLGTPRSTQNLSQLPLYVNRRQRHASYRRQLTFLLISRSAAAPPIRRALVRHPPRLGRLGRLAIDRIAETVLRSAGHPSTWKTNGGPVGQQSLAIGSCSTPTSLCSPRHRDKFRRDVGLLDYDFLCHFRRSTTVVSDGSSLFTQAPITSPSLSHRPAARGPPPSSIFGFPLARGPRIGSVIATSYIIALAQVRRLRH